MSTRRKRRGKERKDERGEHTRIKGLREDAEGKRRGKERRGEEGCKERRRGGQAGRRAEEERERGEREDQGDQSGKGKGGWREEGGGGMARTRGREGRGGVRHCNNPLVHEGGIKATPASNEPPSWHYQAAQRQDHPEASKQARHSIPRTRTLLKTNHVTS